MSSLSRLLTGAAWFALAISPAIAADRGALPNGATRLGLQSEQAIRAQKFAAPAATTSTAKELVANVSRAYPASCFSDALPQTVNSLPTTPSGTLYSGTVTLYAVNNNTSPATSSSEDVTITIFRVPCSSSGDKLAYNPDGGPVSATLLRIQRQAQYDHDNKYYPTFPGIRVAQGSVNFDNPSNLDWMRVAPEPNTVVSDFNASDAPVVDSATYVLENYPYQGTGFFDFNNAFSIRFDNFITSGVQRQFVFNIPAYSPTQGTYPAAFLPLPINGYLTGSWYDPTHSGEGILTQVFDVGGGKRVFAMTWYTFDNTGLPFWLFGTAQFNIGATSIINMPVYYRTGGGFAGNFTPGFPQPSWGTMSVQFADCNHMTFSYNGTGPSSGPTGSGTKNWQRIGSINSLACQ